MKIIITFIAITGIILGSFAMVGGHLSVFWQPAEYAIILGGAGFAFWLGTPAKSIKIIFKEIKASFKKEAKSDEYIEIMTCMHDVLSKMSREGMIQIEQEIENPQSSLLFKRFPKVLNDKQTMEFIADYIRMLITCKMTSEQLDTAMGDEIAARKKENEKATGALYKSADGLPAFGIVAAVMGVVHVMGSVGQVSNAELGTMIGAALVGTFIGILAAYGYVAPLAQFIEERLGDNLKKLECVQAILFAYISYGFSPAMCVEYGRKTLHSGIRPTYLELEDRVRTLKSSPVGNAANPAAANVVSMK